MVACEMPWPSRHIERREIARAKARGSERRSVACSRVKLRRRLRAAVGDEREQPSAFDGPFEVSLLLRVRAGAFARHELAAGSEELAKQLNLFVVDDGANPAVSSTIGETLLALMSNRRSLHRSLPFVVCYAF